MPSSMSEVPAHDNDCSLFSAFSKPEENVGEHRAFSEAAILSQTSQRQGQKDGLEKPRRPASVMVHTGIGGAGNYHRFERRSVVLNSVKVSKSEGSAMGERASAAASNGLRSAQNPTSPHSPRLPISPGHTSAPGTLSRSKSVRVGRGGAGNVFGYAQSPQGYISMEEGAIEMVRLSSNNPAKSSQKGSGIKRPSSEKGGVKLDMAQVWAKRFKTWLRRAA